MIFFDIRNSFFEFFDIAKNLCKNIFVSVLNFAIDLKIRNFFCFFNHSHHKFIGLKSIFFANEKFLNIKMNLIDSNKNLSYSVKNVWNWLNLNLKFEIPLIVFVNLSTIFEFRIFEKSFSQSTESIDFAIFSSVKKRSLFF